METSTCSLLCGDCVQTFDDKDSFNQHNCRSGMKCHRQTFINKDMIPVQNIQERHSEALDSHQGDFSITGNENDTINASIKVNLTNKGYNLKLKDEQDNDTNDSVPLPDSFKFCEKSYSGRRRISINNTNIIESIDNIDCKVGNLVNDNCIEPSVYRKYNGMPDDFRLNRMMRDRDFKLGRTNFYSFKDTLGDWDERSTQSLIELIQKHPKAHFLLSQKSERRLVHWENIHKEMCKAGYSFTVLQLRMRWREVLRKYRWTVDYNDHHSIKKTCEYMDEMNQLFGEWDCDATMALFEQMKQIQNESAGKQLVRVGFAGWERISANLMAQGHRFSVYKVEARWRNLVNLYKTMVDHNAMPHVQPYSIAFQEQLQNLVVYEPNRRKRYERQKGKKVTQERFPETATQLLLQLYKDNIQSFHNPSVNNTLLWEEIRQNMEESGHVFPTHKLKDILTGIIKGYENCQYHNSLPGAICREVPYYRELSEIYDVYRCWPHIKNRRSLEHRMIRKFRLRLQSSQQSWSTDESHTLLQVYPDVLESHVNQAVSNNMSQQQPSDLWLQVAKSYQATGKTRRDVPEIAIHIGLLRQGYIQGNNFPFMNEMRRVKEMEEAVCYSPDVSKFTGDIEVIYWSHDAVHALLDLYIKHQQKTTSGRELVFLRITEDLNNDGYMYTKQQVNNQFQLLTGQFKARLLKTRIKPQAGRTPSIPAGAPYENKLHEIYQLREDLCLSWTNNVKALPKHSLKVLLEVSNLKFKEFFSKGLNDKEIKEQIQQVIQSVRLHIRKNKLLEPIPETRQVRHHLIKSLQLCAEGKEDIEAVVELLDMLKDFQYEKLLNGVMNKEATEKTYVGKKEQITNIKRAKYKKNTLSRGVTKRKRNDLDSEINHKSLNKKKNECSDQLCSSDKVESCQEIDEIPEYLTITLSCIQEKLKVNHIVCKEKKQEYIKDLVITISNSNKYKQHSIEERVSKRAKFEDFHITKLEKEKDKEKLTNTYLENHDTAKTNKFDISDGLEDKNTSRNKINVMQYSKMPTNNDTLSNLLNEHKKERKRDEEELFLYLKNQEEEQEVLAKEMLGLFNRLI
ncbi:unnamed protein product, partial [Meganyctiphanes norvegica]